MTDRKKLKRVTDWCGWYLLAPIDIAIDLILLIGDIGDKARPYSLTADGYCQHGYHVWRRVTKRPFREPVFTDTTNCPGHRNGEVIFNGMS